MTRLARAGPVLAQPEGILATAWSVAGTVVEVRVRGTGRNAVAVPVLDLEVPGRGPQRAESWMGSGVQGFEVGQSVPVRYDPADPGRVEVDTFAVLWGLALVTHLLGDRVPLEALACVPPREVAPGGDPW